jgi:dimethylaniline monooxygenase (N-oxide forming)
MDYTNVRTACVIGAGVAGLATARSLREAGVSCTVFDRNEKLGGVWTDGYLDYGVQVPKELYEFPDFPLPEDTPQFTPGPVMQQYLENYADQFGVRDCIRLGVVVEDVRSAADRSGWSVEFSKAGSQDRECYDIVVVCVGLYSNIPYVPDLPGDGDFKGKIYHISDLKAPKLLEGKRIAVVGFGKSATDAACAAMKHADAAHIIARRLHWPIPRKLAGLLPFKWGLLNRLTVTMIPLYKSPTALELRVHTIGRPLVWLFWRAVELLLCLQCQLWSRFGSRQSLVPDDPVEIGAFSEATMLPRPEFYASVRDGRINLHRGSVERFVKDGVLLSNGTKLEVDAVIFGTGWRSDYSFLSEDLQRRLGFAEDGIYLYRQILHPDVDGLVFIGYASTVSNILAYCIQACWLAALINGMHKLPDRDIQRTEIERLKAWKRSWIPFSHARGARLIVHLQHYLDELLTDVGINPLRKRGLWAPLAEIFAPYQPSDYRDITPDGSDRP